MASEIWSDPCQQFPSLAFLGYSKPVVSGSPIWQTMYLLIEIMVSIGTDKVVRIVPGARNR